jgi:hypothetical protein
MQNENKIPKQILELKYWGRVILNFQKTDGETSCI